MSGGGFYKRRRGVVEHIETGTVDLLETGVHDYLSLRANLVIGNGSSIPAGVCFTSAPALRSYCRRWVRSDRTMQRILEHMEQIGWIKTWPKNRGNYPTLICRATVHDLSGNEYRVSGEKTTDWRHPVYEPVGELSPNCPEVVRKLAGLREVRDEKRKRREKQTPATPSLGVCEQVISLWNAERGPLPEVLKLTPERRRKILARIEAEAEFPRKFLSAVQKATRTPFLCGAGSRGWKAGFDWFIANDTNYVAVLEGRYDGGKGGQARAEQQTGENLVAAGLPIN